MIEHENDSYSYEDNEIPQDEEYVPKKKIVIGKQLLLMIQLIVCGLALLFMVVMKLIGTGFCGDIMSWYETKYYDSIYPNEDGKNDLSIFGIGGGESKQSGSGTESGKDNSEGEKSGASSSNAETGSESSKSTST